MSHGMGTWTRRQFVRRAAVGAAVATFVPRHVLGGEGQPGANEKLNMAGIGVGGRGGASVNGLGAENIVALCDVDTRRAAGAFKKLPKARKYRDFRKMLDEMDRQLDAVFVATPDHTHAVAAMAAVKRGKHVYCEKPLAHSVFEIRQLQAAPQADLYVSPAGQDTWPGRRADSDPDGTDGPLATVDRPFPL